MYGKTFVIILSFIRMQNKSAVKNGKRFAHNMSICYVMVGAEKIIEDNGRCTVYGIRASTQGESCTVEDISPDKAEVERIMALLDRGQARPVHLYDIISDLLGRFGAV